MRLIYAVDDFAAAAAAIDVTLMMILCIAITVTITVATQHLQKSGVFSSAQQLCKVPSGRYFK